MSNLVKLFEDSDILVADIKKENIKGIVEIARKYPKIQKIRLFGSALESRCTKYSDIDIAIYVDCSLWVVFNSSWFLKFKKEVFLLDENQDYDFIPVAKKMNMGTEIKYNIEKGKIIYESNS